MDENVKRTIENLADWDQVRQFRINAETSNRLTPEIAEAIRKRSIELGKRLVASRTGQSFADLSPAEEKIIEAVAEYAAIKAVQRSHASYTFRQIKNHGLLGAAEAAVSHSKPTTGFQALADADHADLSYERIIVDHPDEFSPRALWYAKRTLGLPDDLRQAPAAKGDPVQTRTQVLLSWLQRSAKDHGGKLPPYTNADAAYVLGFEDMGKYGRVQGNIQSRIDFACYRQGLPPLGLTAEEPFEQAWGSDGLDWVFPVASMQEAAQGKLWLDRDFDAVLRETERLPGQAHLLWKESVAEEREKLRAWAYSFGDKPKQAGQVSSPAATRNERWGRDELILALHLYLSHREKPLQKGAPEILELSQVLNELGKVLGQRNTTTYRNENGVYMKLMNFRNRDPEYTAGGKVGLKGGNKDEEEVWREFAGDPVRLADAAEFIRKNIQAHTNDADLSGPDEPEIAEAEEGKLATRVHRYRERDRGLIEKAKAAALKKYGRLFCMACDFDFVKRYGDAGEGVIDVHHTKPIHTMQPGDKTKVTDLVLLCSNCHRIVHSKREWLNLEQVKAALR